MCKRQYLKTTTSVYIGYGSVDVFFPLSLPLLLPDLTVYRYMRNKAITAYPSRASEFTSYLIASVLLIVLVFCVFFCFVLFCFSSSCTQCAAVDDMQIWGIFIFIKIKDKLTVLSLRADIPNTGFWAFFIYVYVRLNKNIPIRIFDEG